MAPLRSLSVLTSITVSHFPQEAEKTKSKQIGCEQPNPHYEREQKPTGDGPLFGVLCSHGTEGPFKVATPCDHYGGEDS